MSRGERAITTGADESVKPCQSSKNCFRPAVVHARELVEVGRAGPACVLETLSDLAAVDIALDLGDDDPRGGIERDHVWTSATPKRGLSSDEEERLADELVGVGPEEVFDLALVKLLDLRGGAGTARAPRPDRSRRAAARSPPRLD